MSPTSFPDLPNIGLFPPSDNDDKSRAKSSSTRKLVVFSGGSAANSLVDVFEEVIDNHTCSLTFVIPISDNGGSSSELIRVFGGPGIGDVRSRLVRLIPPTHAPIRALFNHRLPPDPIIASTEFQTLLTGTSPLWTPIPTPQALLIRSILSHLHLEILKRARPPTNVFNFQSASLGNLFLTGARLFSGSFESAIYLLALMGGVEESRTAVVPAVSSNFTHHIAAGLKDGGVVTGQNAISHPSEPTALNSDAALTPSSEPLDQEEDANPPFTLPTLRKASIAFSKSHDASPPLASRIERVWYISPYGHEMRPSPNPRAVSAVSSAEAVVYSIGSLYTSIIPSLILRGVGDAIAKTRFKILILNGSLDRETAGFSALDFIDAIVRACEESRAGSPRHDIDETADVRRRRYVTHLIHLEGEGVPVVAKEEILDSGIECVRLYGRKGAEDGMMRYDGKALSQALGAILGKRDPRGDRSRRNTLES